jgi:hypothetical protein
MQTPSRRVSTLALVAAALVIALSFYAKTNRNETSNAAAQHKVISAENKLPVSESLKRDWPRTYGQVPLSFEGNQGQASAGVQFLARGEGYDLSLMSQEADFTLRQSASKQGPSLGRAHLSRFRGRTRGTEKIAVLRMRLDGSNPNAALTGEDRTATKINYFIGNDPKKWHTDVPAYAKVKYSAVYPGIDLVYYGNRRALEYDFVVAPGADAKSIAFDVKGASKMRLDSRGNLILSVAGGAVELKKPDAYQELNGLRREVAGNYKITNHHEVRFALADYDRTQPLTIDPVVTYATYFGGSGNVNGGDIGWAIALDAAGDAYIGGTTSSANLTPVNGIGGIPTSVTTGATSGFVAELNPTGTATLYVTYLGGSTSDGVFAIAVDGAGNIYLTGFTQSADFPVNSANTPYQPLPPGSVSAEGSAFVTRLNPALGAGQLVYSTFLGGSGSMDEGNGVAVDANGDAFITGVTLSATGFPIMNASTAPFSTALKSTAGNAFVTEINTGASGAASLLFSSYFGGTGAGNSGFAYADSGAGIVVDSNSNAYLVGTTSSTDFPIQGATQISSCGNNSTSAAFVSVINLSAPATPALSYSTCLAGTTAEVGQAIALGPSNVAYLTGAAYSADFPLTTNTIPLGYPGPPPANIPNINSPVAFVSTVNTTTGALGYSTFLGGNAGDIGFGIGADSQGVAYVTGLTQSSDFPVTQGALQTTLTNAIGSTFVSKVNASAGGSGGQDLLYSTYYGGTGDGSDPDAGNGIAVSGTNAYVVGQATTGLVTSPGAYQLTTKNATGTNAFVSELPLVPTLSVTPNALAFGTQLIGTPTTSMTVTVTNNSSGTLPTVFTVVGPNAADFVATPGAAMGCGATLAAGASCTIGVIFTPSVATAESGTLSIANSVAPAQPFTVALTGTGSATADFSLTVPATFNLTSGTAGSIPVMVNGLAGFNGSVNLTCAGNTPNVTSCTIPATGTVGSTVNAVVIATTSFVVPPQSIQTPPSASMRQVFFLILGISMLCMIPMRKRYRTRFGMAAAMLVFGAVAGCAGGPPGPNSGSGSITITGTGTGAAAGITHSYTVNLTISK